MSAPNTTAHSTSKIVRWAALPTFLMALLNAGAGPASSGNDVPAGVAWAATVVGLIGIVAGVALLRRVGWGAQAVAGVAALNNAGGLAGVVAGWDGGPVGIILGAAALLLVAPALRARS